MIVFDRLTKVVTIGNHKRTILSSVSLSIPTDQTIALFATSEVDRKAFIYLLTGTTLPTSGSYRKPGRVSFPIGMIPNASKELSFRANVSHVARLYGMDVKKTIAFVEQVTGMGEQFDKPMALVPRDLVRSVAQIVGFSLPFDLYVTMVEPRGPGALGERCRALFELRAQQAGVIIAARRPRFVQQHADMSLLIHDGRLRLFDSVEEGWDTLQQLGVKEVELEDAAEEDGRQDFL
jgi:capsular polysaccharide transport system ATP-binding protein